MASVNKVILIGNLGRDPELRYLQSGIAVCNFSIATSEKWADKNTGEMQERTEWHQITCWEKTAENCTEYLAKGDSVYIEGKLQTEDWTDKDGNKRKTTKVIARFVQFLKTKRSGRDAPSDDSSDTPPLDDSDVPF